MTRLSTLVLAIVLISLAPNLSSADVEAQAKTPPRSYLGVSLGIAAPVGVGLEYGRTVKGRLEIAFGFGLSSHSTFHLLAGGTALDRAGVNPQASAMARYGIRRGLVLASVGAGLSGGRYVECYGSFGGASCEENNSSYVAWSNVEVGVELSSQRGPFVRLFAGGGYAFLHSGVTRMNSDQQMFGSPQDRFLPYLGVSAGHSL
ncbi:MAG: hypothetical protein ACKV2T_24795 [Kofleriaceae bacterium]